MDTTAQPLSQLVSLLGSSLALYVADAGIWTYPGSEEIKFALAELVDDANGVSAAFPTWIRSFCDAVRGELRG